MLNNNHCCLVWYREYSEGILTWTLKSGVTSFTAYSGVANQITILTVPLTFDKHFDLFRTGCANAAALHLLSQLVPLLHSTPAPVGGGVAMVTLSTLYEMLWSHSEFTKFMCSSHDELPNEPPANTKGEKNATGHPLCLNVNVFVHWHAGSLIELLVAVVELEPSVCKKQHVPVLLASYSATRSNSGIAIFYTLLSRTHVVYMCTFCRQGDPVLAVQV